jgi:hypothetical protein
MHAQEVRMDYGSLLSRAWQVTWRHKVLWLFGVLAAIGSAGNAGANSRVSADRSSTVIPPDVQQQVARPEFIVFAIVVAFVLLLIALALIVITTIARAGLIGGIRQADERGALTFREAWSIGTHYFWRMIGIALMLIAPALLFVVFAGVIILATFGLGALLVVPLACVFALAYIPFAIVAHFAQFAVVVDDLRVGDAFRRGWSVLQSNLGPIIILGVLLLVIGFVAGLILLAPFVAIVAPAAVLAGVGGGRLDVFVIVAAAVAFLVYLPIALLASGILQTWTTAVWTLAWKQFTAKDRVATTIVPPPAPMPA